MVRILEGIRRRCAYPESTMTSEIKPIDHKSFEAIYTPKSTHQLNRFIRPTRDWFDLSRRPWLVDPARDAHVLAVPCAVPRAA
jgi:hypothetical protein